VRLRERPNCGFGRDALVSKPLRELPERERRAVVLSAIGLSYPEIAEHTADTVRPVDRLLRRATQRLSLGTPADVPPSGRAVLARLASRAPADAAQTKLGISAPMVREHAQSACRRLGVATLALAIARLRSAPH
jgi:DNA-binding CsgD family transcriptional regulator